MPCQHYLVESWYRATPKTPITMLMLPVFSSIRCRLQWLDTFCLSLATFATAGLAIIASTRTCQYMIQYLAHPSSIKLQASPRHLPCHRAKSGCRSFNLVASSPIKNVNIISHGTKLRSAYVHLSPTSHPVPFSFRCLSSTPTTLRISAAYRSMADRMGFSWWKNVNHAF